MAVCDVIIIGGGAAGLMAAYGAGELLPATGNTPRVTIIEKMPRPARKIILTGKGRCNFSNLKDWNSFSQHIRSKASFVKPALYNLTPEKLIGFMEDNGLKVEVERGDRVFPLSHHGTDVIDTLVRACERVGVEIRTGIAVSRIRQDKDGFLLLDAKEHHIIRGRRLIIATGGLSYPGTGSTGDGYAWAQEFGHRIIDCFPSVTALVPVGYKSDGDVPVGKIAARAMDGHVRNDHPDLPEGYPETRGHLNRNLPLASLGEALCGISLKNVELTAIVNGQVVATEFGDIDFTDGGLEGPIGFQVSRRCVKAIVNGSKVSVSIDLKPKVPINELQERVDLLWKEIRNDPRSKGITVKEMYRILLGKLMPWEIIPVFRACNQDIFKVKKMRPSGKFRKDDRRQGNMYVVDTKELTNRLKDWVFDIAGYVGYERCVVTAGGVDTDEVLPKTMESRLLQGLYFCGEVLDVDCDTGGYNLQSAFSTGYLAGQSAAKSL